MFSTEVWSNRIVPSPIIFVILKYDIHLVNTEFRDCFHFVGQAVSDQQLFPTQ